MSLPQDSKQQRWARLSWVLLAIYDLAAVVAATVLAVMLRFDALRMDYLLSHLPSLPIVLLTYLVSFIYFRLYRFWWQYASVEMLWSILLANIFATAVSVIWQVHLDDAVVPRSIIILTCLLSIVLIGMQRLLMRMLSSLLARGRMRKQETRWEEEPKRTIILADGHSAVEVLIALEKEHARRYEIVGILDDEPLHHGTYLRGYKFLGPFALLHQFLRRHAVDEVIIAITDAGSAALREYVLACCHHKVPVRVVPVIAKLLDNPSASRGRLHMPEIRVEDLLHRPSAQVNLHEFGGYLTGARVLVTGAGGSIGSELCRQISSMRPSQLLLLGHGENSIYAIAQELRHTTPELADRLTCLICDVRDAIRLHALIEQHAPTIIFHAAAHKHVPLMEENIVEAMTNNVGGTRNVVRAATRYGVERMVLISTDKAVNPSSIMGASKFLCEEVVRAEIRRSETNFLTVRFGNVLGSRGSVLPTFLEQIKYGGPVTVTHQEMRRFFMTIPEAVSLVLQAGASNRSGGLFVLDMGKPVRILDLAEDVIRLSGLEPYRDIDIVFCGLRQGEKLREELLSDVEQNTLEVNGRLMVVNRPQYLPPDELDERISTLLRDARRNQEHRVLDQMLAICPSLNDYLPEILLSKAG